MIIPSETNLTEPRYEAAFFYGLFLRGHSLEKLRQDIDVPPQVLDRWNRQAMQDPWYRDAVERILAWPIERVLIAHGEPATAGGKRFVRQAFGWLLGRSGR